MLKGMAFWHWALVVLLPAFLLSTFIVAGIAFMVRNRPFD